ncbi:MAG: hypothetical protein J0M24_23205 [Verrucomicrobia bacterium]|nr:hypothetical protein [Verrucomicrobiota bacterium]
MNTWQLTRALVFLQTRSLVNAVRMRIRRLKQPKYLIGAVVGFSYLYFWFGRAVFGNWRSSGSMPAWDAERWDLIQSVAAMVLGGLAVGQWIFTGPRAALQFSETELAFLLPAPLSRKLLIRYKLIRGQLGTLLSALLLTLFTGRFAVDGKIVFHVLGWWIAFTLLNLHGLGSSFTVQRLTERGLSSWLRRTVGLSVVALLAGAIFLWLRALPSLPAWRDDPRALATDWSQWAELALTTGPGPWLLAPFRWAVAPWFAQSTGEFLIALGPALLMILLLYWWVERNDVAFEEASLQLSEKQAALVSQAREGKRKGVEIPKSVIPAAFVLKPTGPPAVALMWKNLIAARATRGRLAWFAGGAFTVALIVRWSPLPEPLRFSVPIISFMIFVIFALLGGTQTSSALRRDLGMLDVLRGYPLPGRDLVLGELLGPAAVTWILQAVFLITSLLSFPPAEPEFSRQNTWLILSAAVSALIVVAPLNLVNALIPSTATLLFPAWAKPGRDIQQPGFEAMGQRIVFGLAQLAVMVVALAPAAAVGAGVVFGIRYLLNLEVALLVGSVFTAAVLAVEAWFGMQLLGRLFDRYDASSEQM